MRILNKIWLVSGVALFLWFLLELWQVGHDSYLGVSSGAFKAQSIAVGYSFLCIVGALGLIKKSAWGKKLILGLACITVLYVLTGGLADGGVVYAVIAAILAGLSIATIVILLKSTAK